MNRRGGDLNSIQRGLRDKRQVVLSVILLAALVYLTLVIFDRIPIENSGLAVDWRGIWASVRNGRVSYQTGLRVPPWGVILLLPFGFLSMRASWGLISLASAGALVASLPQGWSRRRKLVAGALLATSYSTIRLVADGNLEFFIIAGILLAGWALSRRSPWGLAGAVLLMALKIQETWLLLAAVGIHVLRSWPRNKWLAAAGMTVLVAGPLLAWLGGEWWTAFAGIQQRGSLMDASLWAGMARLGLPAWVTAFLWGAILIAIVFLALKRPSPEERMWSGLLISASLLLAPYAGGNSLLTVLAIGGVPLLAAWPTAGVLIFLVDDIKYFLPSGFIYWWGAIYATGQLLLIGTALYIHQWRALASRGEIQPDG